jgi:formylmethanofuran dehydrogenase subunit D
MARYRQIKKYGDTWVIKLNPIDAVDFNLEEGDEVEVEGMLSLIKEEVIKK